MKRLFNTFISKWSWSFLLFVSSIVLLITFINSTEVNSSLSTFIVIVLLILFISSLMLLIISSALMLVRKKTIILLIVIILSAIGILFGAYFFYNKLIATYQPDGFADNLLIPKNIEINIPKGERFSDGFHVSNKPNVKAAPYFEIYHTEIPGIYNFAVWTEKMEEGIVYLKAYEITNEYSLSANDIRQNSSIKISNPENQIMEFGPSSFIIHEGDWDKFYGARFEVWFSPVNSGKGERKLMEKIYKIEGYSN